MSFRLMCFLFVWEREKCWKISINNIFWFDKVLFNIWFYFRSLQHCEHVLIALTYSFFECGYVRIVLASPGYRSNDIKKFSVIQYNADNIVQRKLIVDYPLARFHYQSNCGILINYVLIWWIIANKLDKHGG